MEIANKFLNLKLLGIAEGSQLDRKLYTWFNIMEVGASTFLQSRVDLLYWLYTCRKLLGTLHDNINYISLGTVD